MRVRSRRPHRSTTRAALGQCPHHQTECHDILRMKVFNKGHEDRQRDCGEHQRERFPTTAPPRCRSEHCDETAQQDQPTQITYLESSWPRVGARRPVGHRFDCRGTVRSELCSTGERRVAADTKERGYASGEQRIQRCAQRLRVRVRARKRTVRDRPRGINGYRCVTIRRPAQNRNQTGKYCY